MDRFTSYNLTKTSSFTPDAQCCLIWNYLINLAEIVETPRMSAAAPKINVKIRTIGTIVSYIMKRSVQVRRKLIITVITNFI